MGFKGSHAGRSFSQLGKNEDIEKFEYFTLSLG